MGVSLFPAHARKTGDIGEAKFRRLCGRRRGYRVCGAKNAELVHALGADHVIDYTTENYSAQECRYDVILDSVSDHSLFAMWRCLEPRGKIVFVGVGKKGPYNPPFWWRIFQSQVRPYVVADDSRPNAAISKRWAIG